MDNNSGKQSRWWKDIMTIGKNESGNQFLEKAQWKVGNGDNIQFGENVWLGSTTLKDRLPRMYDNAVKKSMRLSQASFWENNTQIWNILGEDCGLSGKKGLGNEWEMVIIQ